MELYYAPPRQISGDEIILEGDESAHLVRVMRKRSGEDILVADGTGMAYSAKIIATERRRTICRIIARHPQHNEPPHHLTLAVGLTKNPSRFDTLVEKTTEIGVARIIPLLTQRTIRHAPRSERWRAIALAAMKQSGRSRLPELDEPASLIKVLSEFNNTTAAILHEGASGPSLKGLDPVPGFVLIGPEGGFTDEELQEALDRGCRMASLGVRRLRTETAAVAAAALILLGGSPADSHPETRRPED